MSRSHLDRLADGHYKQTPREQIQGSRRSQEDRSFPKGPFTGPRPLALDLFCGPGTASRGLAAAGFEVVGIDIDLQPLYPFSFEQGDALEEAMFRVKHSRPGRDYALIFADPPAGTAAGHEAIRTQLETLGVPWILAGTGSSLADAPYLCGTMFHLGYTRHRSFAASFPWTAPGPCDHVPMAPRRRGHGNVVNGIWRPSMTDRLAAYGLEIDYTETQYAQAVPPVFAETLAWHVRDGLIRPAGKNQAESLM